MQKHQYVFKITDRGLEHCMCFDLAKLPLTDVQRIKAAVSSGRSRQSQPTRKCQSSLLGFKIWLWNSMNRQLMMKSKNENM